MRCGWPRMLSCTPSTAQWSQASTTSGVCSNFSFRLPIPGRGSAHFAKSGSPTLQASDMTSMEPVTRVEHEDGIATITLCRADTLNAFDADLAMDFSARLKHLGRDQDVRVIVITGSGRAFSAGQDVYELARDEVNTGPRAAGDQLRDRFLPII